MITSEGKEAKQIQVALVEDHPEIRQGVSFIINNSSEFHCTSFENAEDALEHFKNELPDVVLMDINLPGMDGIECTRIVKEKYPHINILMCTSYDEDDKVFSALAAGASGYILKRAAGDHLLEAIKDLYHGGSPMSSEIARKVVATFRKTKSENIAAEAATLTPRENEILDLLAQGFRNKEIADKLFVSVNTIRTHVYNVYEKLHVQGKIEALSKTGRMG